MAPPRRRHRIAEGRRDLALWALAGLLFALGVLVAVRALARETGPDPAVVPTVLGLTRTTAEARIRAAGLVADVERGRAGRRAGVVVRQQPEPGATVSRGSIVGITVTPGAGAQ